MAVRNEKVILSLQDDFTTPMARAAAATALLHRELNSLSGTAVQTSRDSDRIARSARSVTDEVGRQSAVVTRAEKSIDRYSGRLRIWGEVAATIGPALIPLGAAAIPALTGLTVGLGAAAGAAGVAILAFHGVGDALKAIDAYQLAPTTENLQKMHQQLAALGPAGADFARFLDQLEPQLHRLQDSARAGLFPGLEAGIRDLEPLLPKVREVVAEIASTMGQLAADAGESLSGGGLSSFLDYLDKTARPILTEFARSAGNVAEGLGHLVVAFTPLTTSFSIGLEHATQAFADWAAGLSHTEDFQNFVDYVRESGPQAVAALGAISSALIGIIRAAAPFGQAVLPVLTALANLIADIANSPLGTPLFTIAAGMLAVSRAATILNGGGALSKIPTLAKAAGAGLATLRNDLALLTTNMLTAGATSEREMARIAASSRRMNMALSGIGKGVELVAIVEGVNLLDRAMNSLFHDQIDTTNLDRNLQALADGRVAGNLDKTAKSLRTLNSAGAQWTDKILGFLPGEHEWNKSKDVIDKIDQSLAQMVESGHADEAAKAFGQIQDQVKAAGDNTSETTKWFKQYNIALQNAADSTKGTTSASTDYAIAAGRVAEQVARDKAQVAALTDAMKQNRTAALSAFDAVTQYGQALDAARAQAKKSNAGLNASTAAGRKNRDALSQLAAAWNNQSDAVRNNTAKFHQARKDFIDVATAMGVPIGQARQLAKRLLEIPDKRLVHITVDTGSAMTGVNNLRNALGQLRDKTIHITTITSGQFKGHSVVEPHAAITQGDGGSVPKTGRPYADRHLYLLADGEEVISNRRGQADRYRPLLKAINNAADGATVPGHGIGTATYEMSFGHVTGSLRTMKHALDDATRALDKETKKRDALVSRRDEIRSGIASGLQTDIFAPPQVTNPWAAGQTSKGDPIAALHASDARIETFLKDVKKIRHAGVKGPALAAALNNPDYADLLASMDASTLREYQREFNHNQALLHTAQITGSRAVGVDAQITGANRELHEIREEIRGLRKDVKASEKAAHKSRQQNAKTISASVSSGSQNGVRRGVKHGH